jgi:hypothetical protein
MSPTALERKERYRRERKMLVFGCVDNFIAHRLLSSAKPTFVKMTMEVLELRDESTFPPR